MTIAEHYGTIPNTTRDDEPVDEPEAEQSEAPAQEQRTPTQAIGSAFGVCLIFALCVTPQLHAVEAEFEYPINLASHNIRLPETNDPVLHDLLHSRDTLYYRLIPVWQKMTPPSLIHRTVDPELWSVRYTAYLPEYHANDLFPWDRTMGLNTASKDNYKTINAIQYPRVNGERLPVLVMGLERPVKWIFPVGTRVAEIVMVHFENRYWIQEIRMRTKAQDSTHWEVDVFRPVATREEFVRLAGIPEYVPGKKFFDLRNAHEEEVVRLEGLVERLPNVPTETVKRLLSRPFRSVVDENAMAWSPAADQDFHILPKDYSFGLIGGVDATTCSTCHRQTMAYVGNLVPREPALKRNPERTGSIRGSDGIFTFHPWWTYDGKNVDESDGYKLKVLKNRPYDKQHGLIEMYDAEKSYPHHRLTKYVQESLTETEWPRDKRLLHEIGSELVKGGE